jgi:hypothetical protein
MSQSPDPISNPLAELGKFAKVSIVKLSERPDPLVGILMLGFIFAFLTLAIIGAALVADRPIWGWILIAVCIITLLLTFAILSSKASSKSKIASDAHEYRGYWERDIPDPVCIKNIQHFLSEVLHDIRDRAHYLLITEYGYLNYKKSNIRANIFFPDELGKGGIAYQLNRPPSLKDTDLPKRDDTFILPPTLGSSGMVFETGKPNITIDRLFNLPDWDGLLGDELKWMITLPIKSGDTAPLAILNIDGIEEQISEDIIRKIAMDLRIQNLLNSINVKVDSLPKIKLIITAKPQRNS